MRWGSNQAVAVALVLGVAAGLLAAPPPAAGQQEPAGDDWITERELSSPETVRRAGDNRFATAAATSASAFPDGASVAYVATGTSFPDALAGGPAAGTEDGPILLTLRDELPQATADELQRLGPDRVVVLGGTAAVSDAVVQELGALTGAGVQRLAGANRFATAAAISEHAFEPGVAAAYVATGESFPDALAGGPAAAEVGAPILLTQRGALPQATADELARLDPDRIVVLGGTAAVSDAVADALEAHAGGGVARQAGADRFVTGVAVSQGAFPQADTAYLTTGSAFPDALTGTPAAVRDGAPLLLTRGDCLPASVRGEIARLGAERVVVLGGEGAVSQPAAELELCSEPPLPSFEVDASLEPLADVEGAGGRELELAALEDEHGTRTDFVADEVIVVGDRSILDAFLDRWDGEHLETVDPADHDVDGVPQHRVRVDPARGDVAALPEHIRTIEPFVTAEHRASSEAALGLLAIAAEETAAGRRVTVNLVARPDQYIGGSLTEAPSASGISAYDPNPFNWQHFDRAGEPHTGVVDAWRVLEQLGVADPPDSDRVPVAVLDGGFARRLTSSSGTSLDSEWPGGTTSDTWNTQNPLSCTGDTPCPWHGTDVSQTAFGLPDNGRGGAGTGGPVARGMMRQVGGGNTVLQITNQLYSVAASGARVANVSIGGDLAATVSWLDNSLVPALVAATSRGTLVVTSAGNDGKDLDAQDCAIVCWEEQQTWPCELNGALCVGGTQRTSLDHNSSSNYGDEVTLWAPYTNWVGPNPNNTANQARAFGGTSGSAPFVSGVAALVVAADPSLSAPQVADVLHRTAESGRGRVDDSVRAYEAVTDVIGQEPADVAITQPSDGDFISHGTTFDAEASVTTRGGGDPSLSWTFAGTDVGTGRTATIDTTDFDPGAQELELAVDDGPYAYTLSVQVTINTPPEMTLQSPSEGETFHQSSDIFLEADSDDPDESGGELADSQVEWHRGDPDGSPLATGHTAKITGSDLGVGDHRLVVLGEDSDGAPGTDAVEITVEEDPEDNVPPSANIIQPEDGEKQTADEVCEDHSSRKTCATFTFEGEASDPEDGDLDGADLVWTATSGAGDSLDLGTGTGPFEEQLYVDNQCNEVLFWDVTLTATDSDGAEASDTVEVQVAHPGC